MNRASTFLSRFGLYFAWVFAVFSLLGSLYYSEIRHLQPCHLCWYQRISVYPLAIILGMAAYRQDRQISFYAWPLIGIGSLFAFYHILEQKIPEFSPVNLCGAGPDCKKDVLNYFGFLTMPMLSLLNFLFIAFFLYCNSFKEHLQNNRSRI